ncbi:MAG: peptidase [Acidobacteria bacterium]|nr:peptidase [Acidobacteriota bacterium]
MRKLLLVALVLACASLSPRAQMPPQQPLTLAEVQKALCLADKPEPVPQKYKGGFDAITPRDTMAMLAFVASDGMEGRETGTRGYAIAADYAASLFKMWGIKPAGDRPPAAPPGRGMFAPAPPTEEPRERTYFQDITFKETSDVQSTITLETKGEGGVAKARTFSAGVDYQAGLGAAETITAPVVFAGYGIAEPSLGFDELKGLDLKGKIVLVLSEAPGKNDPKSPFQGKEFKEKYFPPPGAAMQRAIRRMTGQGGGFDKLAEIAKLSPAAILVVANDETDAQVFNALSTPRTPGDDRPMVSRPRTRFAIAGESGGPMAAMMGGGGTSVSITREIADAILAVTGKTIDGLKRGIEESMKPASMEVPGATLTLTTTSKARLVRCRNVLGMIEGSDSALKNEYFVVGAHYDHNGRADDYIWNGADDNGSGSVGVMAIARAMAANPVKPRRSVVFALWTGEEKGLLGSRYYVRHPPFPIEKTVGYLNFDMISRSFDEPTLARSTRQYAVKGAEELVKRIRGDRYATVNLTSGTAFADLTREMDRYVGLDLALRESPLGVGGGGSDHSSFASVKVPYVYYMAAMTTDYHQPSDSVEKVNPELFTKIVQLGYLTSFAFADR